jgi:NADH-quinone oxidoreductase subunit C
LSSADTTTEAPSEEPVDEAPRDERREAWVARFQEELGDAVVGSHIRAGDDLWVRVTRDAWQEAARFAQQSLRCDFFDFLSGIDWLPSPFGRDMDSQEDIAVHGKEEKAPPPQQPGYAGGDTRFQLLAHVFSTDSFLGVHLKADLPDDDLTAPTWVPVYAGANWHERETHEMFGFTFVGHPYPVNLYLPGDFEGYPLRKDFPLLSRRVKPWPGIVDVEPMPGQDDEGEGGDE